MKEYISDTVLPAKMKIWFDIHRARVTHRSQSSWKLQILKIIWKLQRLLELLLTEWLIHWKMYYISKNSLGMIWSLETPFVGKAKQNGEHRSFMGLVCDIVKNTMRCSQSPFAPNLKFIRISSKYKVDNLFTKVALHSLAKIGSSWYIMSLTISWAIQGYSKALPTYDKTLGGYKVH